MSVHTAEPGDIYQSGDGRIWRVTSICNEKTVHMTELCHGGDHVYPNDRGGGVSGLMWEGFVKLEPKP